MKWLAALLMLLVLGGVAVRVVGVDTALWQSWYLNRQPMPQGAIDLGRYRVDIEALEVEGVSDDLSALTYNPERNTILAAINGEPLLIELSLEGQLLRRVRVEGVTDMEGITHLDGDRYVLAEERTQRLVVIELPDDAERVDATQAKSLRIGVDVAGNKGFEGITWDHEAQRLLLVKERDPLRILAVEGFIGLDTGRNAQISISDYLDDGAEGLPLRDLSSITFDERSGHMLLLSDESRLVLELDARGRRVSALGLWRGMAGLSASIPQAEGMTFDAEGRLYIVSEPNLFYRFVPVAD